MKNDSTMSDLLQFVIVVGFGVRDFIEQYVRGEF
jgi:hypothetical protein